MPKKGTRSVDAQASEVKPVPKSIGEKVKKVVKKSDPKAAKVKRSESGARVLQVPKRIWYKPLTWRNHPPVPAYKPLPKARIIFWTMLKQLWSNKKLFGGVIVIYGFLNILLVRGLSGSSSLSSIKSVLDSDFGGNILGSTVSFGYLLVNSGSNSNATSGIYQAMLLVVCSLAFIWALRTVLAKQKARIRDSFYRGMYPLIPFLLLFLLICVQILPLAIGATLYSLVTSLGITAHTWETVLWFLFFLLMTYWSLRMLTASVFALYIVTLPDMTPLRAYRSARQLVYGRRLLLWRKLLFLPFILLILAALIEVPLILYVTPLATWMFFILSMVTLPLVHGYVYNLYREMI